MSIVSSSTSRVVTTESDARRGGIVRSYLELTKARLSALVVMSTAVGFIIAGQSPIDWILLAWTILGTTLAAAAASIFNQLIEINLDAKMKRTRDRPLPTGAISPRHCFILAMLTGYAGIALLGLFVNLLAAGLALSPTAQDSRSIIGVSGGDLYLFRVYDNGDVQFLDLKSAKTAKGIAGWTPLAIDNTRESRSSPSR